MVRRKIGMRLGAIVDLYKRQGDIHRSGYKGY